MSLCCCSQCHYAAAHSVTMLLLTVSLCCCSVHIYIKTLHEVHVYIFWVRTLTSLKSVMPIFGGLELPDNYWSPLFAIVLLFASSSPPGVWRNIEVHTEMIYSHLLCLFTSSYCVSVTLTIEYVRYKYHNLFSLSLRLKFDR